MLTAGQAVSPRSQKVGFLHDWVGEGALQTWGFFHLTNEKGSCSWYFLGKNGTVLQENMLWWSWGWGVICSLAQTAFPLHPAPQPSFPASLLNLYLCLAPTPTPLSGSRISCIPAGLCIFTYLILPKPIRPQRAETPSEELILLNPRQSDKNKCFQK